MRGKYSSTLDESKKLNATGLMKKANANNITADKLLYDHAIQMVGFSNVSEIKRNYNSNSISVPVSSSG